MVDDEAQKRQAGTLTPRVDGVVNTYESNNTNEIEEPGVEMAAGEDPTP